ncbi:carbon storage regulator CsrA [Gryllotalpicola sp.]|uniref:carbon storage regulator CsrA n=1 Tax=Gryllotalpicola sp. TaxID=1932787 RepID=UPI0026395007|nr:carbon storage regulator CsrA [Gryllotalpicola sp.]
MLVLTRKLGESIVIGDSITITVVDIKGDAIRLGIDAPREVRVQRSELLEAIAAETAAAAQAGETEQAALIDLLKPARDA